MNSKATYLRVGLLLIAGIVAIVAMVLFLNRNTVHSGEHFESYFRESVQGLDVGAPVKFRGVQLGQVTEIGLVSVAYGDAEKNGLSSATSRLVFVRYVIDPAKVGRMPDDAIALGLRARLASQGITGLSYLELDFVDPKSFPAQQVPWTPANSYIPSMPSTITQVQDAATQLLAKVQDIDIDKLSDTLQTVLNDLHTQLSPASKDTALSQAAALLGTLRQSVQQADLPGLAGDLRATSTSLRNTVDSKQTKDILASAAQAADRLSLASAKIPALLAALQATAQRATDGTADLQSQLIPTLRDARAAAANLRDTTETLRQNPGAVIFGAPPPRGTSP